MNNFDDKAGLNRPEAPPMRLVGWSLFGASLILAVLGVWWGHASRDWLITTSVFLGVGIGAVNFWLLAKLVRGLLGRKPMSKVRLTLTFLVKASLVLLIMSLILAGGLVRPAPFLVGLSNVFIGMIVVALWNWNGEEGTYA